MVHPIPAVWLIAAMPACVRTAPGPSSLGDSCSVDAANAAPSVTVTTPSTVQRGDVTIHYALVDAESDISTVLVEFSTDGGTAFSVARAGSGGDGTSALASSPSTGTAHTYVWDSVADAVALVAANARVQVRLTPHDVRPGAPVTTGPFTVDNHRQTGG